MKNAHHPFLLTASSCSTRTTSVLVLLLLVLNIASRVAVAAVSPSMSPDHDHHPPPTTAATTADAADHIDGGAVVHLVGDIEPWGWMGVAHFNYRWPGWTPVNYQTWADSKTFCVGDILHFVYPNNDSVAQVVQSDYETCNLASPLATYTTYDDYVILNNQGDYYFISGGKGHCLWALEKFHITVKPRRERNSPASSEAAAAAPSSTSGATSSRINLRFSWIMVIFLAVTSVVFAT